MSRRQITAPVETTPLQDTTVLDGATSQTSILTAPQSSATSTSSSDPTTTSSSTRESSTAQPTTSESSSSSDTTPTTSESSSTPTTSATPTSDSTATSFIPTSTSTSPSPSSSSPGTTTTITSAFTTFIDGSTILTQTLIPTTIPPPSSHSSSHRTALIAGSAAGGTALLLIILSLAFFARRQRFKRLDFIRTITQKRKQERSRANMLAGEDLDEIDPSRTNAYTHYETPWDANAYTLMSTRHPPDPGEDGWSPPTEGTRLMDPLANRDFPETDIGSDLRRVVDDVMGPPTSAVHFSDHSVSSMHRGSVADESEGMGHSRTASNASNMALLEAAGLSTKPSPLIHEGGGT